LALVETEQQQTPHHVDLRETILYLAPLLQPAAVVAQVAHHPLLRVVEMVALVVAERMSQG
jgi:hypothetical protein